MAKSLVDKLREFRGNLRRGFRNVIFSAFAGLFLYGAQCVPNPPPKPDPEPENNPPIANMYVSPDYGQSPLPVSIKLDGDDKDGIGDIVEYVTGIDKNENNEIDNDEIIKTDSYPINEEIIFNTAGSYKILGQVTDSHGAMDKKSLSVIVSTPYEPTVDYDDLNSIPERNFNEESQTIINLPDPYDPNPEDEPVWYTNATSLDGKVNVDKNMLGGNKLILTGNKDKIETYQVELELENIKGKKGYALLTGEIYNLVDIKGELQNIKTNQGERGEVWVADYSNRNTIIKRVPTNPDGTFDFQLDQQLSKFLLRGYILNIDNQPKSFVRTVLFAGEEEGGFRTILFSGEDKSGIKIRAMPSNTLYEITPSEFKTHYGEVNITPYSPEGNPYVAGNPNPGHKKWNFGGILDIEERLEGIEILYIDPITGSFFTMEPGGDQDLIESIIRNNCLRGEQLNIQKDTTPYDPNDPTDIEHYTKHSTYITPHSNWGVVIPDSTLPSGTGGLTTIYDNNVNGYFESFKSKIKEKTNSVITHEVVGHGIYFPGHAILLSNEQSIMNSVDNPELTGFTDIDREASYIGEEEDYRGMEHPDNILGLDYPSQ